jgi:hypothetical protein
MIVRSGSRPGFRVSDFLDIRKTLTRKHFSYCPTCHRSEGADAQPWADTYSGQEFGMTASAFQPGIVRVRSVGDLIQEFLAHVARGC